MTALSQEEKNASETITAILAALEETIIGKGSLTSFKQYDNHEVFSGTLKQYFSEWRLKQYLSGEKDTKRIEKGAKTNTRCANEDES